ncbi:esterase E4-like isoform X1 [Argiope bruennichi]|uniref:esterase E4-like isoform X1 n=2 Tax=Argiope bruennichi TaxID=94029 RepID=UPI002495196A|nr:esterase E4-like isoform X1 [Argiope bruennichi]
MLSDKSFKLFFKLIFILTLDIFCGVSSQEYGTTLTLKQGLVIGRILKTSNGRDFYAFRGIPYATPPIGLLRFKEPLMFPGWAGTLDARDYRSACPQWDVQGRMKGAEDCLFINVFTPSLPSAGSFSPVTYPVMIFIHGGNFEEGSANIYGPEKLMDKGIILVTFNYRLGVFGFLSSGDQTCSGNMGLKDQVLAIRWVRENIDRFGGDPNAITLFGQGSGAASVFMHILSPQSQGLFSRAIMQSGSALCDWALEGEPLGYAREIAQRVKCPTDSPTAILDCLRLKPVMDILNAQKDTKIFGDYPLRAVPVVEKSGDGKFLPDTPINLLNAGNFRRVPLMAGVNRDEGAFFYPTLLNTYRNALRENPNFLRTHLIPMFILTTTNIRGNVDSVSETIIFEYFNRINHSNVSQILHPFINMSTDAMFVACNDATVHAYSTTGAPVYMYTFEYRGENSMVEIQYGTPIAYFDPGVSHGDELLYLFSLDVEGLRQPSLLDNLVSGRVVSLWTDFAKFGEAPQFVNYEYPRWEPYKPESQTYYRIERDLKPGSFYKQRAVDMWTRHLPALAGMTTPTSSPLTQNKHSESLYRTLAWAMVSVSIALLVVVIVLLVVLYNQKRSQSFKANGTENQSRLSGSTLY